MEQETRDKLREQALTDAREQLQEDTGADQELIEHVKALDELYTVRNTVQERLASWTQDSALRTRLQQLQEDVEDLITDLETACIETSETVMPNTHAVLGDILDCRILAYAGSLEDLAQMPSSTIQVLGAEKAMFRHLRGEGKMPKHGVLYQHPTVHTLPEERRGNMARFLANKTSIAARLDYYGDKNRGDDLREQVDNRFNELQHA